MRLVRRISIASLVVSVATLALVLVMFVGYRWESAEDTPIFTENEVEKLVRYSQGDDNCFANFAQFGLDNEGYAEWLAGEPSQTIEYTFKPDGRWLVDVTTGWKIPKPFVDMNPRQPNFSTGYFMSENKDQIELNCIYLVNEHTGDVTFKGLRSSLQDYQ